MTAKRKRSTRATRMKRKLTTKKRRRRSLRKRATPRTMQRPTAQMTKLPLQRSGRQRRPPMRTTQPLPRKRRSKMSPKAMKTQTRIRKPRARPTPRLEMRPLTAWKMLPPRATSRPPKHPPPKHPPPPTAMLSPPRPSLPVVTRRSSDTVLVIYRACYIINHSLLLPCTHQIVLVSSSPSSASRNRWRRELTRGYPNLRVVLLMAMAMEMQPSTIIAGDVSARMRQLVSSAPDKKGVTKKRSRFAGDDGTNIT